MNKESQRKNAWKFCNEGFFVSNVKCIFWKEIIESTSIFYEISRRIQTIETLAKYLKIVEAFHSAKTFNSQLYTIFSFFLWICFLFLVKLACTQYLTSFKKKFNKSEIFMLNFTNNSFSHVSMKIHTLSLVFTRTYQHLVSVIFGNCHFAKFLNFWKYIYWWTELPGQLKWIALKNFYCI